MDLGRASYLPELSSSTNSEAATATHRTDQQILGPQEASRAAQSIWKHEHHQQSEQQQHLLSDTAARGIQESGGNAPWGWAESLQMDAHREEQLAQDSQAEARPSGGAETLRTSVLGYMVWPDWEDSTTMIVGDPIPMTPVAPEAYPALGAEERRFVLAQITFITGDGVSVAAGEGFYWWGNLMVALEGLGSLPFRRRKLGLEGQAALRHELRGYARARDFPPEAPAAKELVRRREQAGSAKLGWDSLDVYEWVSAQHALHLGWKFSEPVGAETV